MQFSVPINPQERRVGEEEPEGRREGGESFLVSACLERNTDLVNTSQIPHSAQNAVNKI
jgi:hypothetical protein